METMTDDEIKGINNLSVNFQNKEKNAIEKNFIKMKFSLEEFIKSKVELDKNAINKTLANNLFIHSFFKKAKPDIIKNLSHNNNINKNKLEVIKNLSLIHDINSNQNSYQNSYQGNISSNDKNNILESDSKENTIKTNLGKKRYLDEQKEKNEIGDIYNEIKRIYEVYTNNNKGVQEHIIYKNESNYYKKEETIFINNEAICTIYFSSGNIIKIFLINENKSYDKEDDIKYILENIKKEFKKNIIEY